MIIAKIKLLLKLPELLNRVIRFISCFIALKAKRNPLAPFTTILGITNRCNLKCNFCFQSLDSKKLETREKGFMSFELYKKIISQIKGFSNNIEFGLFGEPTLHKDFLKFIDYANKQGFHIDIFTNGTLLNQKLIEGLIDIAPKSITFSIDALYSQTPPYDNDQIIQVIFKIKDFIKHRNQQKQHRPFVIIRTIETSTKSLQQIELIKSIKADQIISVPLDNWSGDLNHLKKESNLSYYKEVCVYPWFFQSIDWDGDVTVCCDDFALQNKIGNVNKDHLQKIWGNNRLEKIRKILSSRLRKTIDHKTGCKNCSYLSRSPLGKKTFFQYSLTAIKSLFSC